MNKCAFVGVLIKVKIIVLNIIIPTTEKKMSMKKCQKEA